MSFAPQRLPSSIKIVLSGIKRRFSGILGILLHTSKPRRMSDAQLLKIYGRFGSVEELIFHLKNRASPIFFFDPRDRSILTGLIKQVFPAAADRAISRADKVCSHIFDLLGSGPVRVSLDRPQNNAAMPSSKSGAQSGAIDWHIDFKTGRRWPLKYYRSFDIMEPEKPSDIKVPWELSRCKHFTDLGKAYWLTGDEKYAREFQDQVISWIASNPYGLGVNWVCPMDVAIRACNWLLGWFFFSSSPSLSSHFCLEFLKSLFLHGCHIMSNLENKGDFRSNHYLADLAGLLYLGIFFQDTELGTTWKTFALKELASEMMNQVNADGMDFEGSTCYHRLALELFFFSTLLAIVNDTSFGGDYRKTAVAIFGEDYVERLYKMFKFISFALKPNGRMPQLGDNDDGRLHVLSEKGLLDMRYLLDCGAVFFNDPSFKFKEYGYQEDALWMFGEAAYLKWLSMPAGFLNDLSSRAFSESGLYIMRKEGIYAIVSCLPNGQAGNGGHNHNDLFSFELQIDGQDVFVDPGTFTYTGDFMLRNMFRGTAFHNTVMVDGHEINRFRKDRLFHRSDDAKPKIIEWLSDGGRDILEAGHSGYSRLADPVLHRRKIILDKNKYIMQIEDLLEGKGRHIYEFFFRSPHVIRGLGNNAFEINLSGVRAVRVRFEPGDAFRSEIEESWISPSYGLKERASCLHLTAESSCPFTLTTLISREVLN